MNNILHKDVEQAQLSQAFVPLASMPKTPVIICNVFASLYNGKKQKEQVVFGTF